MSALVQGTKEWLDFRKNKLGASDAPVIMGVSPWTTPLQLWEEKVGLREPRKVTKAMQEGITNEEKARQMFEKETGIYVLPNVVVHPSLHWLMASYDGIDIEEENSVELKWHSRGEDFEEAKAGRIPEKYIPQVQVQLLVKPVKHHYYYACFEGNGVLIEVKKDDKYIEKMLPQLQAFWEGIQNFIAPDPIDKDYVRIGCATWNAYEDRYVSLDASISKLEKEKEELRKHLLEMAGNQNVIGNRLRLSKIVRKGLVDYKTIPELEGVNLEKYRKAPTTTWRITNAEVSNARPKI
jgi:putative phage-type endonuclease